MLLILKRNNFLDISLKEFRTQKFISLFTLQAHSKGCTATEYGLVFGIFEFVVFLISPIYGQNLNKFGATLMFNGGIYTTGICAILFGLLDKIEGRYPFIIFSFIIRIVEALGNAAFLTASFAIIAKEFPDNIATTFASLETFFGLGLIVGPTVGGALYQAGGYTLPFAVMGSTLFLSAILTAFVLPKHDPEMDKEAGPSMLKALKIPGVLLSALSIVVTSMSIGFLQASLEPHLRSFHLKPIFLGLMFIINGGVYAMVAPVFGWLCDKFCHPKVITVIGAVLVAAGFCLIGPAPFIPVQTTLWLTMFGLVLHGLGMAAQLVASFSDALRTSVSHGFPNNVETYGLISGLWTSTFALGAFIGPSVSGILFDIIGFAHSTMFVVVVHLLVALVVTIFICLSKSRSAYVELQDEKWDEASDLDKSKFMNSVTESMKSVRSVGNGMSIEKSRPPGMNSLIACNSYKSQAWPKRDASSLNIEPYTYSYGAVEQRNGIPASTSYLQGVA
ncbi:hypothetical protein JTB14_004788 [Gonioctena quinquepunctata]|nr:hypothetical protein JTB14_004788 [Gonioctena quinquepunctata]